MPTSRSYHSYLIESFKDDREAAAYLDAVIEKCNYDEFCLALKNVAAWKNQTIDVSRTFVVTNGDTVVGYYCLSSAAIDRIGLPKARPRNMPDPIPAALIGRLAVDSHSERLCQRRYQGQKIGVSLLQDAICRIVAASKSVGMAYILVHALDDGAKRFYEINGFVAIPERPLTLFLPVATAINFMQSEKIL
jgi:GNAT superfamily N-acetyltransferase